MTLTMLLDNLEKNNIQLWMDSGKLRYKSPEGAMTENLKAKIIDFKSDIVERLQQLDPADEKQQDNQPFAQTPIQQAYIVGRSDALNLGGVAANSYLEFERGSVDFELAQRHLNTVIKRHGMLRTILLPDDQQRVLETVPDYQIPILDISLLSTEKQEAETAHIRIEMGEKVRDPYVWPLFDMQWLVLSDRVRLHSCIDLIGLDAWSCQLLFREWFDLIEGKDIENIPAISFQQCIRELKKNEDQRAAVDWEYWEQVLPTLPLAPDLPKTSLLTSSKQFKRMQAHIEPEYWQQFKQRCQQLKVTPTAALSTLFANVLSIWSRNEDLTLNFTLFNRPPIHDDIHRVLGEFTNNTLVAYSAMDSSFISQVNKTQDLLLTTLEHSSVPGIELLRRLARQRQDYSGAIMPVVITSLLMTDDLDLYDGLNWDQVYGISQTPQVALDHQLYQEKGGLSFNWDLAESALDLTVMANAFDFYKHWIIRLSTEPALWQQALDRQQLQPTVVQQAADQYQYLALSDTTDISQGFWSQLTVTPDNQALIWSQGDMSYAELASRVKQCANQLVSMDVVPGDRVVVQLQKGPLQIIAVLAVLYVGAVYVPVSADLPTARIANICQQTQPIARIISHDETLANKHDVATMNSLEIKTIAIDLQGNTTIEDLGLPPIFAAKEAAAYIIFTSGSTGDPKGVTLSHGAVQNTLDDMIQRFGMTDTDRVFALSALNFDLSVYDIFAPLSRGAAIVLPDEGQERNPEHWHDLLQKTKVTIWNSVPTLLQMLLIWCETTQKRLPDSMRLSLVSGDWVPLDLLDALEQFSSNTELIALGGATEAAIWSNWQAVAKRQPEWKSVPYGVPLTNQYYRVLDKYGVDRPAQVPGELYIGGEGVALGYWADDQKTNQSFISISKSYVSKTNERLYKTGDLGCFWQDGTLEFLGRTDSQIKLAGHRIELGEITAIIEKHPHINRAVSLVNTRNGGMTLVAYVVKKLDGKTTESEIKAHCSDYLPRYMVPGKVMFIDNMPLSANGKIDQSALPNIEELTSVQEPTAETEMEDSLLTTILQNILGKNPIDKQTNFFELGATSLQLITAHGELVAATSVDIPVIDFFTYTTIYQLEKRLEPLLQAFSSEEIQ